MNRSVFLGVLGVTVGLYACGGDTDVGLGDGGGGNDTGTTQDTGIPQDDSSVTDTGTTADSSPVDDGSTTDAGSDGTTSVDASTFSVAKVPGLALWLDANKGVTQAAGKVSGWANQSGNNNNAAQSTSGNRPGFTASAINSLPGVHFDAAVQGGTFMTIVDSATLSWSTGDYLMAVVVRYTNDPTANFSSRGALYFKQGQNPSNGPLLYANAFNGQTTTSGFSTYMSNNAIDRLVSTGTGYNDNKGHLFVAHRGGTTLDLRHNGAADGTKAVTAIDVSAPSIDVMIGAMPGNGFTQNRLTGDIAEVIAVKGAISSGDLTGIEGYLKSKYGL